MPRPPGTGRPTCESYKSIDVRVWHRQSLLQVGRRFPWTWIRNGQPSGRIDVRSETDRVTLAFRVRDRGAHEWKSIEQRVEVLWTECHFGGHRPWFCCPIYSGGRRCGRRVALLYGVGELFACRHCYGLAYESQRENQRRRCLTAAQKVRLRLGGSANMLEPFPQKPKRMHWRTYERWLRIHDVAEERSTIGLMGFVERLRRRTISPRLKLNRGMQ